MNDDLKTVLASTMADLETRMKVTSEQRLAELLAEFEAAWDQILGKIADYDLDYAAHDIDLDRLGSDIYCDEYGRWVRLRDAARRYIIARDNGIFDDSWEVMWKLRFGGSL